MQLEWIKISSGESCIFNGNTCRKRGYSLEVEMEETKKTAKEPEKTAKEPEKTFTQDELNAIVADRLGREKSKYADYEDIKAKAEKFNQAEESNKSEVQKATEKAAELQSELDAMKAANEIQKVRGSVAAEMEVPAELLTGTDEASCKAQAEAIKNFANTTKSNYPNVPNGSGREPTTTKEEILNIKNERERVKAIEDNIDLFK